MEPYSVHKSKLSFKRLSFKRLTRRGISAETLGIIELKRANLNHL